MLSAKKRSCNNNNYVIYTIVFSSLGYIGLYFTNYHSFPSPLNPHDEALAAKTEGLLVSSAAEFLGTFVLAGSPGDQETSCSGAQLGLVMGN
jgi:hypothetical protein